MRNYRITDGIDTFCLNMLVPIWLSSWCPSNLLCGVNAKVFSFRGRHSDNLAYSTASYQVEDALTAARMVAVTVAPEHYRPWSQEFKDHQDLKLGEVGGSLFVTVNRQGDIIWSDSTADCIFIRNYHNPMKIKLLGQPNCPGSASKQKVSTEKAKYTKPIGVRIMQGIGGEMYALFVIQEMEC